MLIRTHLAIAAFAILLLLPHVTNKLIFIFVALAATYLPDVDTGFSSIGNNIFAKVIRFLTRHRGMFHSLTICVLISAFFALFVPVLALPFFLGYSSHIFADSFTQEGIMPFWPWRKTSSGLFKTGGRIETGLFISFLALDIIMIIFTIRDYF